MIRLRFKVAEENGLRDLQRRLSGTREFNLIWGEAVAKQARANAIAKGGRKFWHAVADATRVAEVDGAGVAVRNDYEGARHKQVGGMIEAPGKGPNSRNRKYLVIPVDPEARSQGRDPAYYGRSHEIEFVRTKRGGLLLGYTSGKGKDAKFRALFVLKRRVVQKAYPWFPGTDEANQIGQSEAQRFFRLRRA